MEDIHKPATKEEEFIIWLKDCIKNCQAGAERLALVAITGPQDQRDRNELACKTEQVKKEVLQEVLDMFDSL